MTIIAHGRWQPPKTFVEGAALDELGPEENNSGYLRSFAEEPCAMTLEFDIDKTFEENMEQFRAHLEGLDPECAKILFDNLETLLRGANPRAARAAFNQAVLAQLVTLLPKA
jgi:hypothetical protein